MISVRLLLTTLIPGAVLAYSATSLAETPEERVESLDQKVRVLERKLEIADEDTTAKAKQNAVLSAGDKGFSIKSADGDYELKLRGYVQADSRNFLNDDNTAADSLLVRRVRPIFDGTVSKYFDFRLMFDFAASLTLVDSYLDVKYWPAATIRVGRFKPALSLLRLQSDTDLLFAERALVTDLTPDRDYGVQVGGALGGGTVNYALGVFNGAADSNAASTATDSGDRKDVVARLFFQPWYNDAGALQGLGFGVAGSTGNQQGGDVGTLKSTGQQNIFAYKSSTATPPDLTVTVLADGKHTRVVPQLFYYRNNFGLLAEYARSSQQVKIGTSTDSLDNAAWDVELSWVVTGEDAAYNGVKPKTAFAPGKDGWGALELGLRYSALDIDDKAFSTFADPKKQISEAKAVGVGANWYLNKNVKLVLDYEQTSYTGGAGSSSVKDKPTEKLLLGRVQLAY